MLKAIAIDDEPIAQEVVKSLSSKISFIELAATFTNAFKAIEYLQKEKVDLIFLDIKMPDISGIDLLKSLTNPPMVIFTTAYSEHAVQSFELDAIDYLLKPFSLARFLKACNKAQEQLLLRSGATADIKEPGAIFIKSGYEQIRVEVSDILYVESSGNYMQFVLENRKIASRLTMSETEALLPAPDFIRVHRSYIVSKKHIHKMDRKSIWIKQTELPIGAAYISAIEKIIK
ncbi:LytTR family DNA-binding domain-containing protein [Ferruginibacter paludis]|uniref:LytR/AlgR family response regulator transcription factor n=1 Tax=Ferruginibacter paludis TaxID=1310417 RepID=UPI0025B2E7D7|nr:LytTR family DNA-binding domain-containing protein [Ferruginibacter paludis]MDN3657478.1 LytTR family DNA-binding domain-containing protein [Ferruginibacter paludis]